MSLLASLNPFHQPRWDHALPDGAVVCERISHHYGRSRTDALHDVSFTVPEGTVTGLLGLNGAGKSTLLRILFGLLTPVRGRAAVLGLDPQRDGVELRRRTGYVMDTPRFHDWMTIADTLAFHAHYRRGEWNWRLARQMMDEFELPADARMSALSKGMGVKVALILALAFEPEVLILDEPTLGLDPQARRQLIQGVISRAAADGRTVLISSHQIAEISGVVDRLAILKAGQLSYSGDTEQFLSLVRRARLTWTGEGDAAPALAPSTDEWLRYVPSGREALVSLLDESQDGTWQARISRAFPGATVQPEDLSLEEAFLEFVGREPAVMDTNSKGRLP
jgi:ABC-2 type transport system ATP-binding protein